MDKHRLFLNWRHLWGANWNYIKGYIFGYWHPVTKRWFGGKVFNRNRF